MKEVEVLQPSFHPFTIVLPLLQGDLRGVFEKTEDSVQHVLLPHTVFKNLRSSYME